MRGFVFALATALLAGCATQAVETRTDLTVQRGGEHLTDYRLPRASVQIELLAWGSDQFAVRVYQPTIVADERFRLYANERPRMFSDDAIRIEVEPGTRLLRSINVVSQDQTAAILAQAGAFYGADVGLEGFELPRLHITEQARTPHTTDQCPSLGTQTSAYANPVQVGQAVFDPLDGASIQEALAIINGALARYRTYCHVTRDDVPDMGLLVRKRVGSDWLPVVVAAGALQTLSTGQAAPERPAPTISSVCEEGICIPSSTQVLIAISAPNGGAAQALISVPDADELRVLHLDRALFVRNTTAATFSNGMVSSISVTRPSQALAVATLPVTVGRIILGTFTEVVQLRININANQRAVAGNTAAPGTVSPGVSTALPSVAEAAALTPPTFASPSPPGLLISAASFGVPASAYIPQAAAPATAQPKAGPGGAGGN